jgi:hypothetical protein
MVFGGAATIGIGNGGKKNRPIGFGGRSKTTVLNGGMMATEDQLNDLLNQSNETGDDILFDLATFRRVIREEIAAALEEDAKNCKLEKLAALKTKIQKIADDHRREIESMEVSGAPIEFRLYGVPIRFERKEISNGNETENTEGTKSAGAGETQRGKGVRDHSAGI